MSDATTRGSTVICTECGSVNEDGATFCGGCGAYLEWEGERIGPAEPEPEAEAEPVPEVPEPSRPTLVDRVKAGLGLEADATPAADSGPVDPARTEVEAAPAAVPGDDPGAQRRTVPVQPAPVRPAPARPVAARQPAAVKPGTEASLSGRKKPAPVEEHRPRPGETICGHCGAGNTPERKFCRRCGKDLAGAAVMPPPPWWRRLFQRRPRSISAGTRPVLKRRSRTPRRLLVLVVLAAVLYGLVRVGWPWVGGAVETVRDRVSGKEPHEPTLVVASSTARGRGATLARDGRLETSWAPAAPGDGIDEYLEATFDEPFRLVAVQIYNGSSRDRGKYLLTRRPSKVELSITNADGEVEIREEDLRDDPRQQDIMIGADDVTAVRLTIKSAVGEIPGTRVALGEMAFFTRS
ncbi:zinc ribbon domain-containing protein [Knoellia aerolata]|uniref:Uncharacterized protein n=1 Tax=Knoellia aerolata DSM 18566 TaxID=1385519 RepID=A0A0A0JVT2_9MICO|nr:zinc ribbon domain-containing protein [Knoellia aerolata]KGN41303.1 hypothetical protein N801_08655 [Knoellia aerolata DSM 18566]